MFIANLELNSPNILALCETNLDDPIDFGKLSVRGYLPLIWKGSSTHMDGLTVYVKEEPPFCTEVISRKLQIVTYVFDWDGLWDHLRDVPLEDIFKLGPSGAASEICEWVQVGIDVYITHRKYQVRPPSSPWFSAACAAAIVHRNYFFVCTKRINLSILKYILYRLVIVAKAFLKLLNLHMLIKQKSLLLPRNLALGTFGELLIVFSTKINLLYLLYSAVQRYCLVHLIKQNFSSKLS